LETGALPIELLSFFNRGASPLANQQSSIVNPSIRQSSRSSIINPQCNPQSTIGNPQLLGLFMSRVLAAEAAVLAELEPLGGLLLVLGRRVVAAFTRRTRQRDDVSHGCNP
jgi:hypothetical protein